MVAVRGCPQEVTVYERLDDGVYVGGGIGEVGVFAGDEVAVEDSQVRLFDG